MIDTIVGGARVFDGVSPEPRAIDVGLVGGRIALLGDLSEREAYQTIAAPGLALAPGFIDVHSHTDELWLVNPGCASKILQGVTTEIGGNCGTSVAPLRGLALERKGESARMYGLDVEWSDLDEFFSLVERNGVALNVATLIGLGTTRRCVRGDIAGPLDADELRAQCALVRQAIEEGGLGVSSGLIYTPSRYADLAELIACTLAASDAGMPRYASHVRSEGDLLLESVEEGLAVARSTGAGVQFSHHKAAGKKNWGKVHRSLQAMDRARSCGLEVHADAYPYVASWTELATILPDDARDGGREETLARLTDRPTAAALALRLELDHGAEWHEMLVTSVAGERNAAVAGQRIDEIARMWSVTPARAVLRLLIEERLDVEAMFFNMNEDDVAAVLSAGFTCIGSDASARAIAGPTARGVPHPRTFGCFPRVFGRFVRQRTIFELGEAVRRMTSLPAAIFGLAGRGEIAVGKYADLVLFDPERIVDTATYAQPYAYPLGIEAVWVNGTAVARGGRPTGALPGRVLRGGR